MGLFRWRGAWARSVFLLIFLIVAVAPPAYAGVTITLWSRETFGRFPHAFFTLHGTPDSGGAPIDVSYGFTAKTVSPAVLLGNVPGMIDKTEKKYIARSDAHFSVKLTDARYQAVLRLVAEWGEGGDPHYSLERRNCVHFVAEAMRRSGLAVVEGPRLMKKPGAFTRSIGQLNLTRVTMLEMPAKQYWAMLPPLAPAGAGGVR